MTYDLATLKQMAQSVFALNPEQRILLATSDGQFFLPAKRHAAEFHARKASAGKEPLKIYEISRESISQANQTNAESASNEPGQPKSTDDISIQEREYVEKALSMGKIFEKDGWYFDKKTGKPVGYGISATAKALQAEEPNSNKQKKTKSKKAKKKSSSK